jgi:putative chitinase
MILTNQILKSICPYASQTNIKKYVGYLNQYIPEYGIDTLLRERHFIAQLAHESGSFNYVKELASGEAYEWRKDLGNTHGGDGVKYKGRGLIQLTGRNNYQKLTNDFGVDFINHPETLESPEFAVKSACWFWQTNGLNPIADWDDIKSVTKRVNGGYNGLQDRINYYELAKKYIV